MHILTINSGSSSLKLSCYEMAKEEKLLLFEGSINRIGLENSTFQIEDRFKTILIKETHSCANHEEALKLFFSWLKKNPKYILKAISHRIVQGGSTFREPQRITLELIHHLHHLQPLAPDHLPQALKAIETAQIAFPDLPQIACFDTAFHRHMPTLAQRYPLPKHFAEAGIIRYGFHGLSFESILEQLKQKNSTLSKSRLIIAHLGNGASLAAVYEGKCRETSMGFTPSGGLMMSTRCGDIDPSVITYLAKQQGLESTEHLINKQSGLLGVSGISSDMQDLLQKENQSPEAAFAINLFCYQAKKFIGAFIAILGGIDGLIFTGGIGENSSEIRKRICENMDCFGITLDPTLNESDAAIISAKEQVVISVMKTNEALMLAKHAFNLLCDPLKQAQEVC